MAEPPDVGPVGDGLVAGYRRQQAWMRHLAVAAVAVVLAVTLAVMAGSVAVATRLLGEVGRLQDTADRNGAELARVRDEAARGNERIRTLEDLLRANGVAVPVPPPSPTTTTSAPPAGRRSTSAPAGRNPPGTTTRGAASPGPSSTTTTTTTAPRPPPTTTPCSLPPPPVPVCLVPGPR